ncbi:Aste57867_25269 [Aphanomyces stellatus]|uniref:Aste57867_25269 protein n=1 Tax=Aphanomyces stellatus TaxID=120398 RepID=A0A485LTD0_9STRA|nr:hypothetical protein As57867_025191 [Aphanomyces stellatus]VFU01895.1 Aste57867_25269 [Aphanomyces stellatus]
MCIRPAGNNNGARIPSRTKRSVRNRQHNRHVIRKLAFFSFLMVALPIATFYYLNNHVFKDSENQTMWSGFGAIGVVNVVIFVYILEAFREDAQGDTTAVPVGKLKQG